MKKKIISLGIFFIFILILFSGCNETTNISNENFDDGIVANYKDIFYCKKIIIRDDDIGASSYLPSVRWITENANSKDFKVTLAVIPTTLENSLDVIEYLNQLGKDRFEFATHGYRHIIFRDIPYNEQYSTIKNGTIILEELLKIKPLTFVPPYGASDTNTTKVCYELGYHSITDMRSTPCYVEDFVFDFAYETGWDPIKHCSFDEFKSSFDNFIRSTDEYFIFYLHDWTFLDEENNINETRTEVFDQIINYINSKDTQYMTIEEAYKRKIDENIIEKGAIHENHYFIDLRNCSYNHTFRIYPPVNWKGDIYLIDDSSGHESIFNKEKIEFIGTKGHFYYITHSL